MSGKKKLQVVFASAECAPFVKTGGLGDVAGSLPAALNRAGAECIVMVPKYATIADEYKQQMEHLCDFYVPLGWRNEYCGLEKLEMGGVTYLFLDNEHYFARSYPYGFFDDGERFAFFSKAVTEALQHLPEGFECDVLHCNDWQTALAPVFLREFYQGLPLYENVRTVFSIHNVAFQGQFSDVLLEDVLGLAHIPAAAGQLRCDADSINYMLGGLHYTDAITTVSPSYAAEIQTPEYGEGLDWILRDRNYALQGILNGIDTEKLDPATDTRIVANFSADDMAGKAVCKAKLQEELGLEVRDDRPLMVMVTRLTRQKGMDLVMYALERILAGGVQVAVLGTGDADYEDGLRWFQSQYPGQMCARIEFDPALSQRMYAGADMFLMPSKFEPCGLSQIIAMRYGTLPVVRETGGLRDTVAPYNLYTGEGTGFSFANFNGEEMLDTVFRAARLFWDQREEWNNLVHQAMTQDFSWTRSAKTYTDLYFNLHPELRVAEPAPEPVAVPEPKAEAAPAPAAEPVAEAKAEPAPESEPAAKAEAAPTVEDDPAAETEKKPAAKKAPAKKAPAKKTAAKKPAAKKAAEPAPAAEEKPVKKATATKAKTATKASTGTAAAKKTTAAKATSKTTAAKAAAKTADAEPAEAPETAAKTATAKKTASKTATAAKTTKAATASKAATKPAVSESAAAAKPAVSETAAEAKPAAKTTTAAAKKTTTAKPAATKSTAPKTTASKVTATKAAATKTATAKAAKPAAKTTAAKAAAETAVAPKAAAKPATTAAAAKPAAKTAVAKATATAAKPAAAPAAKATSTKTTTAAKLAAAKPAAAKTSTTAAKPAAKTVTAAKKGAKRSK